MAITIVAAQPIPAGTLITKDLLKAVAWPADSQMPGSFSDARQVVDRGAIVSLAVNEPLTESKLAAVGAGAGLPPTIPPGMRAISVKVNEVIGVAGFVVPGTRVDVLVTLGGNREGRERRAGRSPPTCRCSPPARDSIRKRRDRTAGRFRPRSSRCSSRQRMRSASRSHKRRAASP